MNANAKSQRVLIWISLIFGAIFGFGYVGLTGLFPPPQPSFDAARVAEIYTANNMQLRIGVVICIITGGFNLPWTLAASIQMARHEQGIPIWAILQLIAGTVGTLIFVLPPIFWGIAAFSPERDPAVTLLMHQASFLTFVTPTSFFIFQALPIVVIGLTKKNDADSAFPRWLGFLMAWYLVIAEAGAFAQLFKTGPFAWNGLFAFWIPLIGFSIWFPLICYTMLRAIGRQERAAHAG